MKKSISKKRYATISYPGLFYAEQKDVSVKVNTTAEELFRRYPGSFRVQFFERLETKKGKEALLGKPKYEKKYHLAGQVFTLAELKAHKPALSDVLIDNVELNGYKAAVKCRPGNWQPLEKNAVVVDLSKEK